MVVFKALIDSAHTYVIHCFGVTLKHNIWPLLYVGQENDVLKISGPVFRNQFYLAWFQSANERRLF